LALTAHKESQRSGKIAKRPLLAEALQEPHHAASRISVGVGYKIPNSDFTTNTLENLTFPRPQTDDTQ